MFLLLHWRQATQSAWTWHDYLRNHPLQSYLKWLAITLSVPDMTIVYLQLDDVTGTLFNNSQYMYTLDQ